MIERGQVLGLKQKGTEKTKIIRTYKPNNLPFLQAQILERIYVNIAEGKQTTLEELSLLTDYTMRSKILLDALNSLIKKGFIRNSSDEFFGFSAPEERIEFFKEVIKRNDYKHKHYSKWILKNFDNNATQRTLFFEKQTVSELNQYGVIHKWYNYLEEFPYSLIEQKMKGYSLDSDAVVLDPFCGSGTTLVSAKMFGFNTIGFDVNPLMTFISKVKTTWKIDLAEFKKAIKEVAKTFLDCVKNIDTIKFKNDFMSVMRKKEINQWLSPVLQKEVSLLNDIINEVKDEKIKRLLLMAMSKSCFDASYVSLCPGTTFYPFRKKEEFWDLFSKKTAQMYNDLKLLQEHNNYGKSRIINDTCLNAQKYIDKDSIDFIITSPPYPNDLEYTRQTRLELYLLDFVRSMEDIQQIKRKMTKGSTKLIFKESNSEQYIYNFEDIIEISDKIYQQTKDKKWGFDYPRMIREYFGDMYLCLKEIYPLLRNGSHFLLVVGDQTIKGVLIPVGDILINMAKNIGYNNCRKELFRIRRSTGHNIPLPEEIVILEKEDI